MDITNLRQVHKSEVQTGSMWQTRCQSHFSSVVTQNTCFSLLFFDIFLFFSFFEGSLLDEYSPISIKIMVYKAEIALSLT